MLRKHDGTEIPEQDAKRFREFVDTHRWQFARTYAAFCPHEYTLRKFDKTGDFAWFVKFVWDNGFWATYGKNKGRYFIDCETGYYYFAVPMDILEDGSVNPETSLINRSHTKEFEFVREDSLFDTIMRVKRLPPERREKWY